MISAVSRRLLSSGNKKFAFCEPGGAGRDAARVREVQCMMNPFFRYSFLVLLLVQAFAGRAQTDTTGKAMADTTARSSADTTSPREMAIFLPLYLDSAFDAGGNYRYDKNFPKFINPGLEFYEGAALALDSLDKQDARLD